MLISQAAVTGCLEPRGTRWFVPIADQAMPGANRVLSISTVAFTACFAVWTIFANIGLGIKDELDLSDTQFGLLVGTPVLTGFLVRVFLGIWTDQIGGRRVFAAIMVLAAIATFLLSYADSYSELLVAALGVGLAGSSFSVGVPILPGQPTGHGTWRFRRG